MTVLQNKICVITGGGGSIGLATARLFLGEGAKIVLVDRDEAKLIEAVATLAHADVLPIVADVTRTADIQRLVQGAMGRWGRIDVVFSNAGSFGVVASVDQFPEDIFDAVYAVHVRGAFLLAKYAVPHMPRGSSIVITSSIVGTRGDPGAYAYVTAKHAQVGLMRCLAKDLAPRGIRVNTVHPGPIDNSFQQNVEAGLTVAMGRDAAAFFDDMIPLGRHGRAVEIAEAVLYLASDRSSFTTGSLLMADGGLSA
ncbi:SDR family NAD(P)-dependent oxidoreductase [Methylocapsa sp. S129]|uniref:SDR family NAD(P)-dependent oxidoreductase n=1 Tax=Methylocapsa sp. S129 TaxID=1641869 RepID=UPI00131E7ED3|nr:SDR family oxidoreductase [Methylocapsa sp. S129]